MKISRELFMKTCANEIHEMDKHDLPFPVSFSERLIPCHPSSLAHLAHELFPVDEEEKLAEEILHDSDN